MVRNALAFFLALVSLAAAIGEEPKQDLSAQGDVVFRQIPLELPEAPFNVHNTPRETRTFYNPDGTSGQYDMNQWVEHTSEQDTRFVVFTHHGLLCSRHLYLGIDQNNDGQLEEILPTGLADVCVRFNGRGGMQLVSPKQPVDFSLDLPHVSLTHHAAVFAELGESGMPWFKDSELVTDTLSIDYLRRDSDGDGLTDLAEELLLTDSRNPDSDGDGIPDRVDPAPCANADKMGRVERAISRALSFFFSDRKNDNNFSIDPAFPFNARYVYARGCGPVVGVCPNGYSVCITDTDQYHKLLDRFSGYPEFSTAEVSWGSSDGWVSKENQVGDGMAAYISFPGAGYIVLMDIEDSEYIPVRWTITWQS